MCVSEQKGKTRRVRLFPSQIPFRSKIECKIRPLLSTMDFLPIWPVIFCSYKVLATCEKRCNEAGDRGNVPELSCVDSLYCFLGELLSFASRTDSRRKGNCRLGRVAGRVGILLQGFSLSVG